MNKEQLFKAVEEKILLEDGEIYGGYVRDLIAGVAPNDIDFKISNPWQFVQLLVEDGFEVSARYHAELYRETFAITRLVVTCNGISIPIDLSVIGFRHGFPDLDVNQLILKGKKIYSPLNLSSIITNIRNKQFVSLLGCKKARIQKMVERGWVEIF